MTGLFNFLSSISFRNLIWLIPIIMLFHELEEWNILKWYKENYIDLPSSTNRSVRVWLIGISLVGFVLTLIGYLIPNNGASAFLICLLIAFTLQNGLQHLYWLFYFKKYAPGVVFSVLFGIPAGFYICFRILMEKMLPIWILIVIGLLIIPGLVKTVKAKNRMTKGIRGAHMIGLRIAKRLWI
jgi:hypothetical protein